MKRYIKSSVTPVAAESDVVRLAAAKNPRTSPQDLAILANDSDPTIQGCVASNPNTPADTLWNIVKNAPELYWDDYWECVASNPGAPAELLDYMIHEPWVQPWLVNNPNISADTLKKLVSDPEGYNVFDYGEEEGRQVIATAKQRLAEIGEPIEDQ